MQKKELMQMRKHQRMIEEVLKRGNEIRRCIYLARNDKKVQEKVHTPGRALVSSPTEAKALANIEPIKSVMLADGLLLKQPEKWLDVIAATKEYVSVCFMDSPLLIRAYDMWMNGKSYIRVCIECNISKGSFYDLKNRVFVYSLALAAQFGLVDMLDMRTRRN